MLIPWQEKINSKKTRVICHLSSKNISSLDSLNKSNSSSHYQHLVTIRSPHNPGLADAELVLVVVYDGGGWPAHTYKADLVEINYTTVIAISLLTPLVLAASSTALSVDTASEG